MTATTRRLIRILADRRAGRHRARSPHVALFVRSYVPLHADPSRGVWTLPPDQWYRWRSEGYARHSIGPAGDAGQASDCADPAVVCFVWPSGEIPRPKGSALPTERSCSRKPRPLPSGRLQVFPLARSGEDAADWLTQMPAVEQALDLDFHVILVVDLQDCSRRLRLPCHRRANRTSRLPNASIAATSPAFVIQAARYLLTEPDETTPRRLRFSLGPVGPVNGDTGTAESTASEGPDAKLPAGFNR